MANEIRDALKKRRTVRAATAQANLDKVRVEVADEFLPRELELLAWKLILEFLVQLAELAVPVMWAKAWKEAEEMC